MGLGVVILANSRPYEGLLASVAVGGLLTFRMVIGRGPTWNTLIWQWAVPFSVVLAVGVCWMGVYNRAVTGKWLLSPYVLHQEQYFDQGVFRFSTLRPPERRPVPHVADFYAHYKEPVQRGRDLVAGTLDAFCRNLAMTVDWMFGMTLETRGAPFARPWFLVFIATIALFDRWVRFSVGTICLVVLGASLVWWCFPHYVAPIYPLGIAVLAVTLRRADVGSRRLQPSRRAPPVIAAVLAALYLGLPIAQHAIIGRFVLPKEERQSAVDVIDAPLRIAATRSSIKQQLERTPGKHLVFVHYGPGYDIQNAWVYHGADLADSRIIFAHDIEAAKNALLIADYPGRSVWRLNVGWDENRLDAYR
jgi:hypothetical protein